MAKEFIKKIYGKRIHYNNDDDDDASWGDKTPPL